MFPAHWTYMAVNIGVFTIPFLFSFHPKLKFIQSYKAFLPAVVITGILFIIWDIVFTQLQVWSFNPHYLLGIYIFNLPLEECLFFFCIPYACMFTHFCLHKINWNFPSKAAQIIRTIMACALLLIGVFSVEKYYTSITFITCSAFLFAYPLFDKNEKSFSKFLVSYAVLLLPFAISNGILTGSGLNDAVVKYNAAHILNVRIGTIPIEDFIYGLLLILTNILVYNKCIALQGKTSHKAVL